MNLEQCLHVSFELWSALFCIITSLCVFLTRKYDQKGALSLIGILTVNAFLNSADALAYYYRGDPSRFGYYIVRITNFAVFFSDCLLLCFVLQYIFRVVQRNQGIVRPGLLCAAKAIVAAGMLLLVLSRFFGFYYAFDEMNRYYRLDSYWLMVLLLEIPLVIAAFSIFSNWRLLKKNERNSFLLFIIVPIASTVIQLFVYGVSISAIANDIAIFTIFISYEMGYADYIVSKERKLLDQMTKAFSHAIDAKDTYTGGHSERVAEYSRMIAERMGLGSSKVEQIYQMALLHDIGKIGVNDAILRKPSRLSDEEYNTIKIHTTKGSEILKYITERPELTIGARWHHERYDGTGYPDGLRGEAIPLEARIICVADSYDAMTSDRSYRRLLDQNTVRSEIEKNIGLQFDPAAAKCMLDIMSEDKDFSLRG